jgi:hypothetical protein
MLMKFSVFPLTSGGVLYPKEDLEAKKIRKRQFNSTRPALMGFSVILKNNPQKSKNDSSQKI